jgi:hypothetical protein
MRDEVVFLQAYYSRTIGSDRDESLANAAIFTVQDGLRLSPEWIRRKYQGLRPSFSASPDINKLLAYFILAQKERSLAFILDEMSDSGEVAKYARSRLDKAGTTP